MAAINKTSKQLQEEIQVLQNELLNVIERENSHPKVSMKVVRLADMLHSRICQDNHADQCGYYYCEWSAGGGSIIHLNGEKKEYYYKALDLLEYVDQYILVDPGDDDVVEDAIMDILQIFFPKHNQTLKFRE